MIIDTNDDRRLEIIRCPDDRIFLCIEDQYGSQETIILDKEQTALLQSYLNHTTEDL